MNDAEKDRIELLSDQVHEMALALVALQKLVEAMTATQLQLIQRFEENTTEVQMHRADVDAYRIELMRKTLNGLRDTEPPPSSGPDDETPPRGRRTLIE